MNPDTAELLGALAATRFGLGARPGEILDAAPDPRGYLRAQLDGRFTPAFTNLAGSADRLSTASAASRLDYTAGAELQAALARDELLARAQHAVRTPAGFRERWTMFWLNHFALEATGGPTEMLSGAFVREAIEPHQFGAFDDLVVAAAQHPAMLIALNQTNSVGPDSLVGKAQHRGVDENLARELMELHTVGANGGYSQFDVIELANALAGWTVQDPAGPAPTRGRFVNDPQRRQPGARRLLGRSYPPSERQAENMLRDLARGPESRQQIAYKIARHFISDTPEPALVGRLRLALDTSQGSLSALAQALIDAPEAWRPAQAKFKTPYEHLVSAYRALDLMPDDGPALQNTLTAMGHIPLWAPSARGASDSAQSWATSLALAQRADLGQQLGQRATGEKPLQVAESALGPLLSDRTRRVLASPNVEPASGIALLLMSPEFLRR